MSGTAAPSREPTKVTGVEAMVGEVRSRIAAACERAGRRAEEVVLIAVTKEVPVGSVAEAAEAGVEDFGENYLTELEAKRASAARATWHFLGKLQSNKVSRVLDAASVIHTLEPGRAADRLISEASRRAEPVRCLVQVDFTGSRVGVAPGEAPGFVSRVASAQGIALLGLMTVPPLGEPPRRFFAGLREMREGLGESVATLRDLSMGMSADYEIAVEEGATMVRVGTAIFGPRR